MYVCGQRFMIYFMLEILEDHFFFNFLRNFLEHKGHKVTYVYNYTDIDDKIINRSKEDNISTHELSEKYINEFEKDYAFIKNQKTIFHTKMY